MNWQTIRYYLIVLIGIVGLLAGVAIVPTRPIWLLLFAPLVLAWGIWLLQSYWTWVRSLGR